MIRTLCLLIFISGIALITSGMYTFVTNDVFNSTYNFYDDTLCQFLCGSIIAITALHYFVKFSIDSSSSNYSYDTSAAYYDFN